MDLIILRCYLLLKIWFNCLGDLIYPLMSQVLSNFLIYVFSSACNVLYSQKNKIIVSASQRWKPFWQICARKNQDFGDIYPMFWDFFVCFVVFWCFFKIKKTQTKVKHNCSTLVSLLSTAHLVIPESFWEVAAEKYIKKRAWQRCSRQSPCTVSSLDFWVWKW